MDLSEFSNFRLIAIVGGVIMVLLAFLRLRRVHRSLAFSALLGLGGAALIFIAAFPSAASVLTELLSIGEYPGSRLITLLILAVGVLWVMVSSLAAQAIKNKDQLDRFIRHEAVKDFMGGLEPGALPEGCVLAVLPALNEERNIGLVLERMPKTIDERPVRALVIDDGSTDDTAGIARAHGALVLSSPFQRGGGAAIRMGFEAAEKLKAGVVVNIDADGQNDPQEMPGLVRPVLSGQADVVIGSRMLGSHEITVWWRHVGVMVFSAIYNILLNKKITDISSGYRAIRADRLRELRLYQDQYHTSEFLVMCAKLGFVIDEAPIRFARRISGESKKGNELLYGFRFARALFTSWARNQ